MKFFATAILAIATTAAAFAQEGVLKGQIKDSKNDPISRSEIKIENYKQVLLSNSKGEFILDIN